MNVKPAKKESDQRTLVFRLNEDGEGPELIREVLLELGWVEFEEDENEDWDWNLWWRTSRFRVCEYDQIYPWQRLNHHPKCTAITKKDNLARNLRRMKHGLSAYNFGPISFNLPNEYTIFARHYENTKKQKPCWICKPADLSRGRGIFIFRNLSELQYDCNAVVQEYIPNPMLISGYKFDLRVYVVVTSFVPLRIYIYEEGLVRFSTEKYDLNSLKNQYAHLTNTSINKHGPAYNMDKERVGPGCKWTLTQLRHYFQHFLNIDDTLLFGRIINIIILTMLIQVPEVSVVKNCFELYGFDILIDDQQKPWLLEVNFSPALSSDCAADLLVKKPMLRDLISMLNFTEMDLNRNTNSMKLLQHAYGGKKSISKARGYVTPLGRPTRRPHTRLPEIHSRLGGGDKSKSTEGSLAPSSTVSWVSDEGDGVSDVVPLIPGCGLPSVQQAHDSGHSTPTELPQSYNRVSGILPKSTSCTSTTVISVTNRQGNLDNSLYHEGSVKKRDSKEYLDSGVSSFSGSSDGTESVIGESKIKHFNSSETKMAMKSSHMMPRHANKNGRSQRSSVQRFPKESSSLSNCKSNLVNKWANVSARPNNPSAEDILQKNAVKKKTSTKSLPCRSRLSFNDSKTSTYAKPWRGVTSTTSISSTKSTSLDAKKTLIPRFGQFFLVFPFNDLTKKIASYPDPATVSRECVKHLRKRVETKSNDDIWAPYSAKKCD